MLGATQEGYMPNVLVTDSIERVALDLMVQIITTDRGERTEADLLKLYAKCLKAASGDASAGET